jgi:DNA-binding NtrC family response regulator
MAKILVVENEPSLREDLEWAVQGSGREVATAQNAKEALQRIGEEDFDVIVTDLRMETVDAGLEVLKAAKTKDIDTQVIVCTAYGSPEISVKTMGEGAFDYLERNSPGTDFLEMIRHKVALALTFREATLAGGGKS